MTSVSQRCDCWQYVIDHVLTMLIVEGSHQVASSLLGYGDLQHNVQLQYTSADEGAPW